MHSKGGVALLVSLAVLAAGCGKGSTLDGYFADLQAITTTHDAALGEIDGSFNAGLLDINFAADGADEQFIDLFRTSLSRINGSFTQLVEGLEGLKPPTELALPHQEAVEAAKQVLADYDSRAEQLSAIATVADIDAYAEGLTTSAARIRFVESCRDLQEIADRDQIDVNLNC